MPRKKTRRAPVATDKRFKKRIVADMGPDERWQHSGKIICQTENAGVMAAKASEEHVLDRLFLFNLITADMRDVGLRLKEDYVQAGVEARVTASYTGPRMGGSRDPEARLLRNTAEEAAYKRWRSALMHIKPATRDVILTTACMGFLPQMMQLNALREGLKALHLYYKTGR